MIMYLLVLEMWFRNLMANLRERSRPVRLTSENIDLLTERAIPAALSPGEVTGCQISVPEVTAGATEDWSPAHEYRRVANLVPLDDVDMDEAYSEYWHHLFSNMEHAAVTDFQVGVNRALRRFGMTPGEMLGAAVMHEGSGEHELVPV